MSAQTAPPTPDDRLSIAQAARYATVEGRPPHPSTVFRWTQGIRGVRLKHWRIGRRIVTSRAALDEFFAALSERDIAAPFRRHRTDEIAGPDRTLAGSSGDVDAACEREGL